MSVDYDVVVVGGGPVGVTALALLGRAGIRAVGVEREAIAWPAPRAVHFDGETLRLLQSIGIIEEVLKITRPMLDTRLENEEGKVLTANVVQLVGAQGWTDDVMFHQPDMEAALRAAVDQMPSVALRSGAELTALEQEGELVRLTVESAQGTEQITARYVIAADGATSTVRKLLGITNEQLGTDDPWLVVDGQLAEGHGLEGDMVLLGHWTRPALWVRLLGQRVRMEFKIMPGDDVTEIVTPAAVERISRGALPADGFKADRMAIYTFRGRVAHKWRSGNVFLAGDAAHQAPPLFGQGLCAGMRDVANLVWKLDLVLRGKAGAELLDTYESERRPHAKALVEAAVGLAGLLQTTDEQTAAQRDAYMLANPQSGAEARPALGPGQHAGADLSGGSLSVQPILEDGTRLDDMVGRHFLVAASGDLLDSLDPDEQKALQDDEVVVLTDLAKIGDLLAATEASAVVVRPDRYLVGVAHSTAELRRLLAHLPSSSVPAGSAQPTGL